MHTAHPLTYDTRTRSLLLDSPLMWAVSVFIVYAHNEQQKRSAHFVHDWEKAHAFHSDCRIYLQFHECDSQYLVQVICPFSSLFVLDIYL